MGPEYVNQVRQEMGKAYPGQVILNTGVSEDFNTLVKAITEAEGTRPARLVYEGLVSVVRDRFVEGENSEDYLSVLRVPNDHRALNMLRVLGLEETTTQLSFFRVEDI